MKQLISLATIIIVLASCNSKKETPVTEEKKAESKSFILDSLLRYNSEAELIAAFGKENVGRDTAWYDEAEGQYMITTLYPKSTNEVKFRWTDSATYTGLRLITLEQDSSAWSTHGVKIGTTLKELIQLNGKDFTFAGLGWNGGGLVSWSEGGNLSDLHPTLDIANYDLPQNERDSLIEAESISSKSKIARKYNPAVNRIVLKKD